MSKLSYEDKINLYNDRKNGMSYGSLLLKYQIRDCIIKYMVNLIDCHGLDILRTRQNKHYTIYEKQEAFSKL